MFLPDNCLQLVEAVCFLCLFRASGGSGSSDAAHVGCVLPFGAKPGGSRLHLPRVSSSDLSPGLQLGMNQLSDSPWLGLRPWQPRVQQSSCGLGLHIRIELCGTSAATGFHPGCAESRFCGSRQPVCLLHESAEGMCVVSPCVVPFCAPGAACPLFPCLYVISLPVSYISVYTSLINDFIEIQSTYHANHPFNVYSSVDFLLNAQSRVIIVYVCSVLSDSLRPHGL